MKLVLITACSMLLLGCDNSKDIGPQINDVKTAPVGPVYCPTGQKVAKPADCPPTQRYPQGPAESNTEERG